MNTRIKGLIQASLDVKQKTINDQQLNDSIAQAVGSVVKALEADKKVLFAGNGGSAADAQHIAAELSGRFYQDRDPLFAEALHVNTSYLTAVANDYSYEQVYSRLIKAKGRSGDVFFGISTSGNSENVIEAMKMAKAQGMINIAMTGETGGQMKDHADILINVPSTDTPRIQEVHILIGHIICELVEERLFQK